MDSEHQDQPIKLYAALVQAQAKAKAVGKDATNPHHNYRYASAEAIIQEADILGECGLAIMAERWWFEAYDERADNATGRMVVEYLLVHESGQTKHYGPFSTPVVPDRGRPPDKAEAAALTNNWAYFLRALLKLARVNEAESVDQRDDTGFEPKGAPPKQTQQRSQSTRPQQQPVKPAAPSAEDVAATNDLRRKVNKAIQDLCIGKKPEDGWKSICIEVFGKHVAKASFDHLRVVDMYLTITEEADIAVYHRWKTMHQKPFAFACDALFGESIPGPERLPDLLAFMRADADNPPPLKAGDDVPDWALTSQEKAS